MLTLEDRMKLVGWKVPELYSAVVGTAQYIIVIELETGHTIGVVLERDVSLTGLDVPDFDRLVVRARDDLLIVGLEATNGARVTLLGDPVKGVDTLARCWRPELDVEVEGSGYDALWVEVETGDWARVAF